MQLTLVTLLACIASTTAQDADKHAHRQRAEHSLAVKATPTTLETVATPVQPETADAEITPEPEVEGNDEELSDTETATIDDAKIDLAIALKKKAKSKPKAKSAVSGKGGNDPNPTHKTNLPPSTATGQPYLSKAHAAIARMQTFYNRPRAGQWTNGWWNSANAYTLLGDLRARDSSTFIKKVTDGPNGVFARTQNNQNKGKYGGIAYDDWYDDLMWWCVGLIKAYDVTGNKAYLTSARNTWKRVQNEARGATCGGLWNNMPGLKYHGQSTIATLLYVQVTAQFAKRYPSEKKMFLGYAKTQWKWVMNNVFQFNYIRGDGMQKVNGQCVHNGAILSYIEGTAINAAVALNAATGDYSYIDLADTIATKSLVDKGLNRSGIAHDNCDMNMGCNQDEAQFKGIFMRGLRNLYDVQPAAAGGQIPGFLKKNADAIWKNTRSKNGLFGQNWAGPFNPTSNSMLAFAQHCSATMALVAAAGL